MSLHVEIDQVDALLEFCATEARDLRIKYGTKYWAEAKANKLDQIATILRAVRQDQQMRGVTGKRIDT